jgi:hypothetical protein
VSFGVAKFPDRQYWRLSYLGIRRHECVQFVVIDMSVEWTRQTYSPNIEYEFSEAFAFSSISEFDFEPTI